MRLLLANPNTSGDPAALTSNPIALQDALRRCCAEAVELDGAEAVVIGGGPLATAARALRPPFDVPIIEPVPAAVRLAVHRVEALSASLNPARRK